MMKEYCALKLMTEMGVPTPQYGLAKLYINNEYYGVYFMLEAMDSSILEQFLKLDSGQISDYLAKPEKTKLHYDTGLDGYKGAAGKFTMDSLAAALHKDEEGDYLVEENTPLAEQSGLWENDADTLQDVAKMIPTVLTWEEKLNLLSAGKDFSGKEIDVNSSEYLQLLGQIMNVDEAVRYFATHSFIIQMDNMFNNQQNFGLYVDTEGKSLMLPWDYDLGWGCYYTPCTSEDVANWDVDQMFTPDILRGTASSVYPDYPLFHVIYQNQSLMDQYHQYMKDCSKIAALGGTTSTGKTYTPGKFSSCIEKMEDPLVKAASEVLADNVYYLHGANQPADMQYALPNLKKIIALRALGVLMQVDGIDAVVSGGGCNLESLGNAIYGMSSSMGRLGVIDEDTGIYAIAQYNGSQPPSLNIRELEEGESVYQKMLKALGGKSADGKMYTMSNSGTVKGNYTLYIPVGKEKSSPSVYSYTEKSGLEKLEVVKEGESYKVTTGSLDYIAVIHGEVGDVPAKGVSLTWIVTAGCVVLLAAAAAVVIVIARRRKK